MTKKVLIFESDAGFAAELSDGLERLGCTTTVVDDASVGLQTAASERPDLILLSIELPRMNGFSVCNKLKRDSKLKGVPLIIMSSDSTDETFEQHRRLRTRAEDYVHKPISFDGLFQHVQQFVSFDGGDEQEVAELEEVLLEDDLEIEEAEDEAPTRAGVPSSGVPVKSNGAKKAVDEEVDNFTEQAFGALLDDEQSLPSIAPGPDADAVPLEDLDEDEIIIDEEIDSRDVTKAVSPEMQEEARRVAAAAAENQPAETAPVEDSLDLSEDLESIAPQSAAPGASEASEAPTLMPVSADAALSLSSAPAPPSETDIKNLAETERLNREIAELKDRLASGRNAGSARDFLDLREQLNKKEKEVLGLRDELNQREKELLGLKDDTLALERVKADLSDQLSELETRTHDLQKQNDAFEQDKQQALKRAEDFKRKADKYRAQLDSRAAETAEQEQAHARQLEALRAELTELQTKYTEDTEQARTEAKAAKVEAEALATAQAEAQAAHERELDQLKAQTEQEQQKVIAAREAELQAEHSAHSAALNRAHDEALAKVRAEFEQALKDAELRDERKRNDLAAQLSEQHQTELAGRDARIGALEGDLAGREQRMKQLESELSSAKKDIETGQEQLAALAGRLDSAREKWTNDRTSLERAKDALAAALAQIEETEARELK